MRAPKNDDSGTVILFLHLVVFYSQTLGCNSSHMRTGYKRSAGNLDHLQRRRECARSDRETFSSDQLRGDIGFFGAVEGF